MRMHAHTQGAEGKMRTVGGEMEIERALRLAEREWENIRFSLRMCGDIGAFDLKALNINGSNSLSLLRNIIEMENKLPVCGYFTKEAASVFAAFATEAGKRLGLSGELAQDFGRGYSLVRTGCVGSECTKKLEDQQLVKQLFFYKMFFPFGAYSGTWDFGSDVVGTKLRLIFDTFMTWQHAPRSYIQDVREYGIQLDSLWHGLSSWGEIPGEFPE
ncbi:MAG TPA: hypothetical protein VLB01_05010 [Thermodesulfobacteriota bacterium]|nr:hypothetical protein [Thermodesulfobacteriota bacterium]